MLHDVVIHLLSEQPLLADLAEPPRPTDAALVCTNLRTFNGKAPVFAASSGSTFVFPMQQVRFVEVPGSCAGDEARVADERSGLSAAHSGASSAAATSRADGRGGGLALAMGRDGRYLSRGDAQPAPFGRGDEADEDASEALLRRIREI